MEKRTIKTALIQRDDVFKVLAVAEATSFPLLLEGPPGTGKTAALLEYARSKYNTMDEAYNNTFILETDEGTRSGDVKGRLDIKKLVTTNDFAMVSPVVDASLILINEVDKATAGLRNSLLSIMNEKMLFNGQEKVECKWKVFCASCNEIPAEEKNSPFWDRFVFKFKVNRISKAQISTYHKQQKSTSKTKDIVLNIPNNEDIDKVVQAMDENKLAKFVEVCYDKLSDRTLSYIPRLVAAVHYVYNIPMNKAMIKVCELLLGFDKAKELAKHIEPAQVAAIRSAIDMIMALDDYDLIVNQITTIEGQMKAAIASNIINQADIDELSQEISHALTQNPVYSHKPELEEDEDQAGMTKTTF